MRICISPVSIITFLEKDMGMFCRIFHLDIHTPANIVLKNMINILNKSYKIISMLEVIIHEVYFGKIREIMLAKNHTGIFFWWIFLIVVFSVSDDRNTAIVLCMPVNACSLPCSSRGQASFVRGTHYYTIWRAAFISNI